MPSKISHEINKLRGESEDTGEVFTLDMASLEASIDQLNINIKELESDRINSNTKINAISAAAKKALSNTIHIFSDLTNYHKKDADVNEFKLIIPDRIRGSVRLEDGGGSEVGTLGATGGVAFDTISELTTNAGVTLDSVVCKDGNVDGRDVATDGTKLDTVATNADVTSTTNVRDSEAIQRQEAWFVHTDSLTNIAVGTIPAHSVILRVYANIHEAFNGSSYTFTVGTAADTDKFGTLMECNVAGFFEMTNGTGVGYNADAQDVIVRYAGANQNAGKGVIVIEYTKVTTAP